jgi:hypothetical protein
MPERISPYGSLPAREQPVKIVPNEPAPTVAQALANAEKQVKAAK